LIMPASRPRRIATTVIVDVAPISSMAATSMMGSLDGIGEAYASKRK
jgi:hypothetical protein